MKNMMGKEPDIVKDINELSPYFLSVLEQDRAAVVLCDLKHEIIYMNPAAVINYIRFGGGELIGKNLLDCHNEQSREQIKKVVSWFGTDVNNNIVYTFHNEKQNKDVYMVALRDLNGMLIGYYEKHEFRDRETMELYDMPEK